MKPQPHSAEQFGPQRDFGWHQDFLDLMATRWRLREAASLADIGCGQGHWSRLLYPYLRAPARLTGVDREPRWVIEATQNFRDSFRTLLRTGSRSLRATPPGFRSRTTRSTSSPVRRC